MPSKVSVLVVLTVGLFCFPVIAQDLPNPTDLKAAYCTRLLNIAINESLKLDEEAASYTTPEIKLVTAEHVASLRSAKQRINAYLTPRTLGLEPFGLIAAADQAQADLDATRKDIDTCAADKTFPCNKPSIAVVKEKVASCRNPVWLPF